MATSPTIVGTTAGAWTNAPDAPTFEAEEPAPTVGGFVGADGFVYETQEQADKVAARCSPRRQRPRRRRPAPRRSSKPHRPRRPPKRPWPHRPRRSSRRHLGRRGADSRRAEPSRPSSRRPTGGGGPEAEPPVHVVAWDEDDGPRAGARTDRRRGRARAGPEPIAASSDVEPVAPTPTPRIAPISETILHIPDPARSSRMPRSRLPPWTSRRRWRPVAPSSTCSASTAPSSRKCRTVHPPYRSRGAAITAGGAGAATRPRRPAVLGGIGPRGRRAPSATWAFRTAANAACPFGERPILPPLRHAAGPVGLTGSGRRAARLLLSPRRSRASASRPRWASIPWRRLFAGVDARRGDPASIGPVEAAALEDDPGGIEHAAKLAAAALADRSGPALLHRVDHFGGRTHTSGTGSHTSARPGNDRKRSRRAQ